jgi:hypothetical protein
MPIYRKGELFRSKGFLIVTANSFLTSECKLVMGRGAAWQLKRKVPGIDMIFGKLIYETCGHLGRYGLLFHKRYGIAQVKYQFNNKADLELIAYSMNMLKETAKQNTHHRYNINFPGIGYGGLSKDEVMPILERLPNNIIIWETPYKTVYPDNRYLKGGQQNAR